MKVSQSHRPEIVRATPDGKPAAQRRLTQPDPRTATPAPRPVMVVCPRQSHGPRATPTWWKPRPALQHTPKSNPTGDATPVPPVGA